ncbi:hypothetical protein HS088_TW13G00758 [Tripterygium wilfordii]|uniref:Mitochondrial transcription termination factor family protein n=1 Tax=Tripterygium wilfordii TaxID=458696 RepID=A0A7J7CUT9_TRIWF|nr:hypothetical protein HS088_TW13G00758 [Tripterygium wilfordii]
MEVGGGGEEVDQEPKLALIDYLVTSFNFSKSQALSIINRFPRAKSPDNPRAVFLFLQNLGFSTADIQSTARVCPQILFTNVEKTLTPKFKFFQDLGLVGSDLGKFMSKSSSLLTNSLDKKLVPCIDILKKTLLNDKNNAALFQVLSRGSWVVRSESKLSSNIAFLESRGIVGSQLSRLLKRQPRLFALPESSLNDLVSRAFSLGFSVDSRMFVHGLHTVSCLSDATIERKLKLLRSFGYSGDGCMEMLKRAPGLLRTSEKKLKQGMEFFLFTVKLKKEVLVGRPSYLMNSLEDRVIPRYRVIQIMKSKRLLKKEPSFLCTLDLTEEVFLDKYISKFRDHAEELLVAYKGHMLDSSVKQGTVLCLTSVIHATPGTAVYYESPYVQPQNALAVKTKGHGVAGVKKDLWNNGAACGRIYRVKCTGGANMAPLHTLASCNPGSRLWFQTYSG